MWSFKLISNVLILASTALLLGGVVDLATAQSERAKLLPDPGGNYPNFGTGVAIYGDTAVIGAPYDDSAYVFRCYPNGEWVREAQLLNGGGAFDFGASVAVFGDVAVIGARYDDPNTAGAAYVFRRDDGGTPENPSDDSWFQEARLWASDGDQLDHFGGSVAIFGDTIVVGAEDDDPDHMGSAYVFRFDGGSWIEEAKLRAFDGIWLDFFGCSVAVSADKAVIGARNWGYSDPDLFDGFGAAYVFRHEPNDPNGPWVHEARLTANDAMWSDHFGCSVGVSGRTAVVGAYGDDDNGDLSGSAYVFHFDDGLWHQEAKLLPADGDEADYFGESVAVWGNTVAVAAHCDDDHGFQSGSAYLYRFDGMDWQEAAKLVPADGQAWDYFGTSVSIFGDTALIGAPGDDDLGQDFGSAYVFGPTWTILVFLNGDNSLDLASLDDFNEMEFAGWNLDVSVVACWDRLGPGNSIYIKVEHDADANEFARYTPGVNAFLVVDPNDPNLPDDLNMGDPNTLTDFTAWALRHYPSEHYLLDIWNHGGGWGPRGGRGVSWDDTDGSDFFTTNEVRDMVAIVADQIGANLDILGFDACLMQMVEVEYAVRGSCDYMVGSEELEDVDGWSYDAFLASIHANSTPTDICSAIVISYCAQGFPFSTSSAFRTDGVEELAYRVGVLADELLSGLCAEPDNIQQARQTADLVTFDYDGDDWPYSHDNSDSYVDLGHLCRLLAAQCEAQPIQDAANDVRAALVGARVAIAFDPNEPYYAPAEGMSIYFPDHQPDWVGDDDYYANYQNEPADPNDPNDLSQAAFLDFVDDVYWWHFLKAYVGNSPCGDLDGDGDVDLADLAQLLAHYNLTVGVRYIDGDIDGDEDVDLSDLAALLANYGEGT